MHFTHFIYWKYMFSNKFGVKKTPTKFGVTFLPLTKTKICT